MLHHACAPTDTIAAAILLGITLYARQNGQLRPVLPIHLKDIYYAVLSFFLRLLHLSYVTR